MARILIIDDDPHFREMLAEGLGRAGFEVIEADNGLKGVMLFRQDPADVVIADILMPEREGLETIMELRRDFPGVKVIAVSGGGTARPDRYLKIALKLGADTALTKPFSFGTLLLTIAGLLKGRPGP